jgi:hypothetical protein
VAGVEGVKGAVDEGDAPAVERQFVVCHNHRDNAKSTITKEQTMLDVMGDYWAEFLVSFWCYLVFGSDYCG